MLFYAIRIDFSHTAVSKRRYPLAIRIIDMIPTARYINMRYLPLLGRSRNTQKKHE